LDRKLVDDAYARDAVLREVAAIREALGRVFASHGENRLVWQGVQFWVDRKRQLVLGERQARTFFDAQGETLVNPELEMLALHVAGHPAESVYGYAELLGAVVVGGESIAPSRCAAFVNYAACQPLVNPAFAFVFWLALDSLLKRSSPTRDVATTLRPLCIDLSRYPESLYDASGVREAQAAFLRDVRAVSVDIDAKSATNEEWARFCASIFEQSELVPLWANVRDNAQAILAKREKKERDNKTEQEMAPLKLVARIADDQLRIGPYVAQLPTQLRAGHSKTPSLWELCFQPDTSRAAKLRVVYLGYDDEQSRARDWGSRFGTAIVPSPIAIGEIQAFEISASGVFDGVPESALHAFHVVGPVVSSGKRVRYELALVGARDTIAANVELLRTAVASLTKL
jgi:hypothetical protein